MYVSYNFINWFDPLTKMLHVIFPHVRKYPILSSIVVTILHCVVKRNTSSLLDAKQLNQVFLLLYLCNVFFLT